MSAPLVAFLGAALASAGLAGSPFAGFQDAGPPPAAQQPRAGPQEPPGPPELERVACGAIENLHARTGVLLASQPSAEDLEAARALGVRTVVNLRRPEELAFDERAVVAELGLAYHQPSFGSVEELTDDVLASTRTLLRTAERPLLLHCASANRVGADLRHDQRPDDEPPIEHHRAAGTGEAIDGDVVLGVGGRIEIHQSVKVAAGILVAGNLRQVAETVADVDGEE